MYFVFSSCPFYPALEKRKRKEGKGEERQQHCRHTAFPARLQAATCWANVLFPLLQKHTLNTHTPACSVSHSPEEGCSDADEQRGWQTWGRCYTGSSKHSFPALLNQGQFCVSKGCSRWHIDWFNDSSNLIKQAQQFQCKLRWCSLQNRDSLNQPTKKVLFK